MNYLVTTPCGTVQGTAGRVPGTAAYKGIRYATAGRWEYPRQMTRWDGVYDATATAVAAISSVPSSRRKNWQKRSFTTTSSGREPPTPTARTACS